MNELGTIKVDHTNMLNDFAHFKEDFKKNRDFINHFVDEFQNFVNKLERRVLKVEHCILFPFGGDPVDHLNEKDIPGKKNRPKPKNKF